MAVCEESKVRTVHRGWNWRVAKSGSLDLRSSEYWQRKTSHVGPGAGFDVWFCLGYLKGRLVPQVIQLQVRGCRHCRGSGRKRSLYNGSSILIFAWRDWGKPVEHQLGHTESRMGFEPVTSLVQAWIVNCSSLFLYRDADDANPTSWTRLKHDFLPYLLFFLKGRRRDNSVGYHTAPYLTHRRLKVKHHPRNFVSTLFFVRRVSLPF